MYGAPVQWSTSCEAVTELRPECAVLGRSHSSGANWYSIGSRRHNLPSSQLTTTLPQHPSLHPAPPTRGQRALHQKPLHSAPQQTPPKRTTETPTWFWPLLAEMSQSNAAATEALWYLAASRGRASARGRPLRPPGRVGPICTLHQLAGGDGDVGVIGNGASVCRLDWRAL